jgi:Holliday junction resolvase
MVKAKRKGYITERKVRKIFEKFGWYVVKAGASLGVADLVCLKRGKCLLIQVKSTRKKVLYYDNYMKKKFYGFDFYVVVDFAYRKIIITKPKRRILLDDGVELENFLRRGLRKT